MAIKRVGNWHLQMGHVVDCVNKIHSRVWLGNGRMILVSYMHVGVKLVAPV